MDIPLTPGQEEAIRAALGFAGRDRPVTAGDIITALDVREAMTEAALTIRDENRAVLGEACRIVSRELEQSGGGGKWPPWTDGDGNLHV